MIDFTLKARYDIHDLLALVRLLRAPGGCAWDGAQTHASIRRNFIEEVYEACEAIDDGDSQHLMEELGDVLLQVVFHAGIEQDEGRFSFDDVCNAICQKLIARHPHLFSGADEAPDWEELKRRQRGNQTVGEAMAGVSRALPSLWRAEKLIAKAEKIASAQYHPTAAVEQLSQEIADLEKVVSTGAPAQEALGRTLFAAAGAAHALGLDPEAALHGACNNFTSGFLAEESSSPA